MHRRDNTLALNLFADDTSRQTVTARILLVSQDPAIRGGIPRYTVPIAEELAARGFRVDYMASGGYSNRYGLWPFRRWATDQSGDVNYHVLINPTSIGDNLGLPRADVDGPDVEAIAQRAASLRPDIIHVHSLLGFPFAAIARFRAIAPVVMSCHDFGLVCQRRVLVQRDGTLCTTYPTQLDCSACVDVVDPRRYRMRARLRTAGGEPAIRAVARLERHLNHEFDVERLPDAGEIESGAGGFVDRLSAAIEAVNNHVDRVLAVSDSVRQVLVTSGVNPDLIDVMHIGSGSAESIPRQALPCQTTGDVTFLYLGGFVPGKGARVLVDALRLLDRPPRTILAGGGYTWLEEELRACAPASVEFAGRYAPDDLPALLARADVVVAPSIGPDTSPQTVLEAQAAGRPVVGARIGGIPDFVTDGENGILVAPGDAGELARAIDQLSDPAVVRRLAAGVARPRTVGDHVSELTTLYEELLS